MRFSFEVVLLNLNVSVISFNVHLSSGGVNFMVLYWIAPEVSIRNGGNSVANINLLLTL